VRERFVNSAFGGWLRSHQQVTREWLVLGAAVLAGFVGWQQIQDERDARKASERHIAVAERREQAEQISTWIVVDEEGGMQVVLANGSNQPVYEAVVSRVAVQGSGAHIGRELGDELTASEQHAFAVIPPGEYLTTFGGGFHGMGREPGIEIGFRDRAGVNWVRFADGVLREVRGTPVSYYGLSLPRTWEILEPTDRIRIR
jgi:hypothetical protein